MSSFLAKMQANFSAGRYSCAGLDPVRIKIPPFLLGRCNDDLLESWRRFLYDLVTAAAPHAGAFKPNWAFYLAQGPRGLQLLVDLCTMIRMTAPHALLILDMKCGDIGNTNHGYAEFAFGVCGADAVTVHPYMGKRAMAPFLENPERGVFVLCKTSNKDPGGIQHLKVNDDSCIFLHIASIVRSVWNLRDNCGLVTGATYPEQLRYIRKVAPELPFLIPGIGTQGGDLTATVQAAMSVKDAGPFVVNQSSSFMYASSGEDYAKAGALVLAKTNAEIASILAP